MCKSLEWEGFSVAGGYKQSESMDTGGEIARTESHRFLQFVVDLTKYSKIEGEPVVDYVLGRNRFDLCFKRTSLAAMQRINLIREKWEQENKERRESEVFGIQV